MTSVSTPLAPDSFNISPMPGTFSSICTMRPCCWATILARWIGRRTTAAMETVKPQPMATRSDMPIVLTPSVFGRFRKRRHMPGRGLGGRASAMSPCPPPYMDRHDHVIDQWRNAAHQDREDRGSKSRSGLREQADEHAGQNALCKTTWICRAGTYRICSPPERGSRSRSHPKAG